MMHRHCLSVLILFTLFSQKIEKSVHYFQIGFNVEITIYLAIDKYFPIYRTELYGSAFPFLASTTCQTLLCLALKEAALTLR